MAAVKNARDILLQAASPRIEPAALPSNISVGWNANILDRPTDDELLNSQMRVRANLVQGISTWAKSGTNWVFNNSPYTEDKQTFVIPVGQTGANHSPLMNLSAFSTFTVSFIAWGSGSTLVCDLFPDTLPQMNAITLTGTPTEYTWTFTTSHADRASCRLRIWATSAPAQVQFGNVKLEANNVKTKWVAHYLDLVGINNKVTTYNVASFFSANTITADYLNVGALDAISANLGTVNAGSITGTANIDITGSAKFKGALSLEGGTFSLSANESKARTDGGIFYGTTGKALFGWSNGANGIGVYGYATGASGTGVYGISTQSAGAGGYFTNTAGGYSLMTGSKISIDGQVFVGNSTVVTNLNADMLDGWHASGFCTKVVGNNGTCNVSGAGFSLSFSTGLTAYEFYSSGNNIMLARSVSDERIKHAIAPEELGLDFVLNLKPVSFRKNSSPEILHHGFIAQDLEKLIGSVNADALSLQYEDGTRGLDYQALIGPLVLAVQQLCNEVRILKEYKNGQNEHDSR
jgi:hypothetical protein